MAEFCLDCWNKLNNTNDPQRKYILSDELDICEECGNPRHVFIVERKTYCLHKFRFVLFPFVMIRKILYILWRILLLPYLVYKARHKNS